MTTQQAAPVLNRFFAHAIYELRTTLRNGEQVLLSLILPALILVFMTSSSLIQVDSPNRAEIITPGVIALAIMSSAFSGQAIATGFERRAGALRMFATTPLGRGGLLGGKVLGVLGVQLIQVVVLGGIGLFLGWKPHPIGVALILVWMILGTASFTALGLLLAGTMRAEAVLAGANILWVLLMVGGGTVLPGAAWTTWLPSAALGDGLRDALIHGSFNIAALAILVVWAMVLSSLTVRFFRWA